MVSRAHGVASFLGGLKSRSTMRSAFTPHRKPILGILLCTAAVLALPSPAAPQDLSFVASGDLVRAARPRRANRLPNWVLGRVVATTPDNLVLTSIRYPESTFELPWAWMTRLHVSRGTKSKPVTGMVVGFLAGIPIGATAGWIRDTRVNQLTAEQSTQRGLRIGAVAGLALGGLIGMLVRVEQWDDISNWIPEVRADDSGTAQLVIYREW